MKYGLPYKGSKNKLAEKIVNFFPQTTNFYDLFAGGFAITHAALVNGKYENYYDVKTAYVSGRNNIKNKINKKKIRLVWSSPTSLDLSKSLIPYNSKSITSIPTGFIKGTFDNLILINSQNKSRKINKSLTFSGYKLQDRTTFNGLNISIENKKGSVRSGTDSNGHKWSIKMNYDYGYIRGTVGTDGDHLDCYLGDNEDAKNVYVIHQNNPDTDKYDEDKVMLGFKSLSAAKKAYLSQYDRPGFLEKSIPRVVTMLKKNQAQK